VRLRQRRCAGVYVRRPLGVVVEVLLRGKVDAVEGILGLVEAAFIRVGTAGNGGGWCEGSLAACNWRRAGW
jgi:hypothetical protein